MLGDSNAPSGLIQTKLAVPDRIVGKTIVDINFRSKFNLNIIVIENEGVVTDTIVPDYEFRKGDILYVSGSRARLDKLAEWIEK